MRLLEGCRTVPLLGFSRFEGEHCWPGLLASAPSLDSIGLKAFATDRVRVIDSVIEMNRRCKIGLALALISGAIVTGSLVMPHEPRYGGRSLSAWLAELDLESSKAQAKPVEAVKAIGTNGLPWLRRMLRSEGPIWERAMVAFNVRQSLVQLPITPDNVVRNRAVRAYHILGNAAEGDVPRLIELFETEKLPPVRSAVALALGNIGPAARAALPVLEKATTDPNGDVRRNAVWAVANIKMWTPDEFPTREIR